MAPRSFCTIYAGVIRTNLKIKNDGYNHVSNSYGDSIKPYFMRFNKRQPKRPAQKQAHIDFEIGSSYPLMEF